MAAPIRGCHLSRDTAAAIEGAGFTITTPEQFLFPGARTPVSFHITGHATAPGRRWADRAGAGVGRAAAGADGGSRRPSPAGRSISRCAPAGRNRGPRRPRAARLARRILLVSRQRDDVPAARLADPERAGGGQWNGST